jgi:uncharacterized MAPEG superfamily protein
MEALLCLLLQLLLAYVPHVLKARAILAKTKHYDLKDPRKYVAAAATADASPETAFISRANACHLNSLESWPQFAVAVLAALLMQVEAGTVNAVATLCLAARVLYVYFFLSGNALLRPVAWVASLGCTLYLLGSAAAARARS